MRCALCAAGNRRKFYGMPAWLWWHPVKKDGVGGVVELCADQGFGLSAHIERQRLFSLKTFGPGARTQGVLDHIRKELIEIAQSPADLLEWVDVILLAIDGAHRAGHSPMEICGAIDAKQTKNERRTWPEWRTAEPGKAIEHVREKDNA